MLQGHLLLAMLLPDLLQPLQRTSQLQGRFRVEIAGLKLRPRQPRLQFQQPIQSGRLTLLAQQLLAPPELQLRAAEASHGCWASGTSVSV